MFMFYSISCKYKILCRFLSYECNFIHKENSETIDLIRYYSIPMIHNDVKTKQKYSSTTLSLESNCLQYRSNLLYTFYFLAFLCYWHEFQI